MPELPDLQVFSLNLDKMLAGRKVSSLSVHSAKAKTPAKEFKKAIEGRTLSKVYREGKQLYIEFDNGTILGLHLMLHGDLHVFKGSNTNKHTVVEIVFDDDTGLALIDWQGAATPTLNPEAAKAPDALSANVNVKFLTEKFKSRAAVKNILLDQKQIRGIGNAYADEILWKAGISPFSIANKIPGDKITVLAKAIHSVLKEAEKQIRKSHPDIISGEVRDFMEIHNSKKTHSPDGAVIRTKTAGGRKTYYTDEQELFE